MYLPTQKKMAYIWQTVLGCVLLVLAYFLSQDNGTTDPTRTIAAWVMLFPGLACLLFGIATFILREEPDIWT
jgi:predicted phage tail protein